MTPYDITSYVRNREVIAIGDIHGSMDKLIMLLRQMGYKQEKHYLVFLGDIVNRGPMSADTVLFVRSLVETGHATLIRGNNEQTWINLLKKCHGDTGKLEAIMEKRSRFYTKKGMQVTYDSYKKNGWCMGENIDWFSELPVAAMDSNHLYVHAGVDPSKPFERQTESDLLHCSDWRRWPSIPCDSRLNRRVICGHTVLQHPFVSKSIVSIDTGVIQYKRLSAYLTKSFDAPIGSVTVVSSDGTYYDTFGEPILKVGAVV